MTTTWTEKPRTCVGCDAPIDWEAGRWVCCDCKELRRRNARAREEARALFAEVAS